MVCSKGRGCSPPTCWRPGRGARLVRPKVRLESDISLRTACSPQFFASVRSPQRFGEPHATSMFPVVLRPRDTSGRKAGACGILLAQPLFQMQIEVVSTLTSDDEERVAEALIALLGDLFGSMPIAYSLRIDTAGSKVFQRSNMNAPRVHQGHPTQH